MRVSFLSRRKCISGCTFLILAILASATNRSYTSLLRTHHHSVFHKSSYRPAVEIGEGVARFVFDFDIVRQSQLSLGASFVPSSLQFLFSAEPYY
jgi:phage FluMu gp28-like protein